MDLYTSLRLLYQLLIQNKGAVLNGWIKDERKWMAADMGYGVLKLFFLICAENAIRVFQWDSVHSPVAVAQVTPMVATVHSNMVADPIPQSLPAGAVIQQHNALQTPPTMLLPSISSTVMATNVARVDPIPSHPVESQRSFLSFRAFQQIN